MSRKLEMRQDVMQVCRNGHVITDLLRTFPERGRTHCDRCGAPTLDHCLTCGRELPGAVPVPGLVPLGTPQPPGYCSVCGAAFPWSKLPGPAPTAPLAALETLLRRLPRVVRQLRWRQGDRPPFLVLDERDLEDLLRALLPLHFDDVRPEGRTPRYSPVTRTDFLLAPEAVAVTVKLVSSERREPQLADQLTEDVAYYRERRGCRTLVVFVYDPEGLIREPHKQEAAWSSREEPEVRVVIAGV